MRQTIEMRHKFFYFLFFYYSHIPIIDSNVHTETYAGRGQGSSQAHPTPTSSLSTNNQIGSRGRNKKAQLRCGKYRKRGTSLPSLRGTARSLT